MLIEYRKVHRLELLMDGQGYLSRDLFLFDMSKNPNPDLEIDPDTVTKTSQFKQGTPAKVVEQSGLISKLCYFVGGSPYVPEEVRRDVSNDRARSILEINGDVDERNARKGKPTNYSQEIRAKLRKAGYDV